MNQMITEQILTKPKASKAESKAEITDSAARAIIGDEVARREAKTAKLRQARLDLEAKQAEEEAAAAAKTKTPAPARRAKKAAA
jgi:hypothetical protein